MGGRSTSSLAVDGKTLVFSGEINTNGGGFASFRSLGDEEPIGLPSSVHALIVDATGDGQRYKLVCHTADSWAMGVPSWSQDFVPTKRALHTLPLSGFIPSKQGRVVSSLPPLDPSKVTGVGFALSLYTADGKPNEQFASGPFRLQVHGIQVDARGN
jgi:hypothetical protein